ncbi:MAG: haloalkane dehalogenase [Desulfatibacillaceae bacterium]
MESLRTPDECFEDLPEYRYAARYTDVPDTDGGTLCVHHVDAGGVDRPVVLLMHGEPSWSYLYRKMIPIFAEKGFRAIAPDLVGFGKSDKPVKTSDYTYQRHVDWMSDWLLQMRLRDITLVCQDWGGLIGLRLVAAHPHMFARVVAANTGLPTGEHETPEAFLQWRKFSVETPDFDAGAIVQMATVSTLPDDVVAAYNAPFPDDSYKAGARIFPSLVPVNRDDPGAAENREAWEVLRTFDKPFLTAFSDKDPITRGGERIFQHRIPGARDRGHVTIKGGGHFLQEDQGEQFAKVVIDFIRETS